MVNVFLIGLGGMGKTTIGEKLAYLLGRVFIDQDVIFRKEYGDIGSFAKGWNWNIYTIRNARHLLKLLKTIKEDAVYSTSPKAFVNPLVPATEKIVIKRCKKQGVTVLVLPSRLFGRGRKIVWNRVKHRPYYQNDEGFQDFAKGYTKSLINSYKKHADIIIYDNGSPLSAARKIQKKLLAKKLI